ncbi:MAG TPA: CopD family protein [Anaerolineales bacterium]|nr:CopD family protein [Anaerolineales bacterium]
MSTLLVALSTWLHTISTIVMIGYFVFTSLIFLPVLERHIRANELCELLEQVSSRLRPFFGGSLLAFLVTGTYLMVINENYLGLGHFFSNPWSSLIVIKHFLLVPFLALAVVSERAFQRQIGDDNPQALRRFRWSLSINMFLGLVILLLTSIAQAQ